MRLAIVDDNDKILIDSEKETIIETFKVKLLSSFSKRKADRLSPLINEAWEWVEKTLKEKTVYLDNLDRYRYVPPPIEEEERPDDTPTSFEWIDLPPVEEPNIYRNR